MVCIPEDGQYYKKNHTEYGAANWGLYQLNHLWHNVALSEDPTAVMPGVVHRGYTHAIIVQDKGERKNSIQCIKCQRQEYKYKSHIELQECVQGNSNKWKDIWQKFDMIPN